MIALADKEVTRVLIGGWWYNVEDGTFKAVKSTAHGVEYIFKYYPKGRLFTAEPSMMHIADDQIDAFKYVGEE